MVNNNHENGRKKPDKHHLHLMKKAISLFGRTKGKYLVLTHDILEKELGVNKGKIEWVMSPLISGGKIASLLSANDNIVYVARRVRNHKKTFRYTPEELVGVLNSRYFNSVGKFFEAKLKSTRYVLLNGAFLTRHADELELPIEILKSVIECFVKIGLLKLTTEKKLSLSSEGKKVKLGYDILKSADLAKRFTDSNFVVKKTTKLNSLADVKKAYDDHNEKTRAKIINITMTKPKVKIAYLTELLVGHQDFDIEFMTNVLAKLIALPQNERPDILVISGLVQGAFQHRQKNRRLALVESLKSENRQFKVAKMILDECLKLKIPIIYNRGNDDREICEMRTVDALFIMNNLLKPTKDSNKKSVNYKQLDDLKQTKIWDFHFKFQWDVVWPYMLRCGRRLYSADEVGEKYGGRIEEYLMLLETYFALVNKQPTPNPFYTQVLETENIPLPGKEFNDFYITDDFDLVAKFPSGKIVSIWEKHNMTLTPTSMVGDPTKTVRAIIGQLEASGSKIPNAFIIEHQQQEFGILRGNTFIASTPGMHTAKLKRNSFGTTQIDPSQRKLTTRRELFSAGTNAFEFTEDGRVLIDFMNENFLNKSTVSPDRVSIALLSDWQNGSVTARPDLQVLMLDYILHKLLLNQKIYLFFAGDIGQGRNYPEMPNENVRMGLIRAIDQQDFVRQTLQNSLKSTPLENLKNLKLVGITPGNHEWNTSHKMTGDTHSGFLPNTLKDFFDMRGVSIPVKYYDKLATKYGEHFNAWVGREDIAGYGILVQHMIMEKGAKGNSSGPAAYQIKTLFEGTGPLMQSVDIALSGHWHTPMYLGTGKKLAAINGALAGISGYEYMLGCRSTMSTLMVHLGGGKPVTLEFITPETLIKYQPGGYYSKENLAKLGFTDDPGFDPKVHGFSRIEGQPRSAIQKALWKIIDLISWNFQSTL